jgi:hypothetical protein
MDSVLARAAEARGNEAAEMGEIGEQSPMGIDDPAPEKSNPV